MFLINGLEQNTLAVNDRATQFGDGCFTTARVVNGRVQLLPAHITRLQSACQRLAIPFELWSTLSDEMMLLAQHLQNGVLKIILSRGAGGRSAVYRRRALHAAHDGVGRGNLCLAHGRALYPSALRHLRGKQAVRDKFFAVARLLCRV